MAHQGNIQPTSGQVNTENQSRHIFPFVLWHDCAHSDQSWWQWRSFPKSNKTNPHYVITYPALSFSENGPKRKWHSLEKASLMQLMTAERCVVCRNTLCRMSGSEHNGATEKKQRHTTNTVLCCGWMGLFQSISCEVALSDSDFDGTGGILCFSAESAAVGDSQPPKRCCHWQPIMQLAGSLHCVNSKFCYILSVRALKLIFSLQKLDTDCLYGVILDQTSQ